MAGDNSIKAQIRAKFAALRQKGGDANERPAQAGDPLSVETPTPPVGATEGASVGSERENESTSKIAQALPAKSTIAGSITFMEMRLAEWQDALLARARELIKLVVYRDREVLAFELAKIANDAKDNPHANTAVYIWPSLPQEDVDGALYAVVNRALGSNGNGLAKADDPLKLPEVFNRKKIEVLTWDTLRERRRAHVLNWAVEGWLAKGEMSMWSGKVEHGKTTLMRELTLCKVRGEPFLGHPCPQGRVFYAMLDADGENLTYDEFEKMGMTDADAAYIRFMFEPMLARMERGPEQFFRAIWDWQPDIVIIDPYARLQQIGDFNDYSNTYLMGMLSHYCKITNGHFALPGHIPRGRPSGSSAATAAFGSIAFGGGVNARFVVERKEGTEIHVLRTSKGKSAGFEAMEHDHVLERDEVTGRITLGKQFSFGHQAAALKPRVLDLLNEAPLQDWTPHTIARELGAPTGLVRAATGMLYDDRKIDRDGAGKKTSPYVYRKQILKSEIPAVKNGWVND